MTDKILRGITLGSLGLIIEGIIGLLQIPILLHYMSKEFVGLWVLFTSFAYIVNLTRAGLSPIVIRIAAELKNSHDNLKISNFFCLVSYTYKIVVCCILVTSLIIYFFYIYDILIKSQLILEGTLVWSCVWISYAIRSYSTKNVNIINGYGELGWDKLLQIFVSLINFISSVILLHLDFGLLGVGTAFLLSNLLYSLGASYLIKKLLPDLEIKNNVVVTYKEIFELYSKASHMFLLDLVGFLTINADLYIIERFFGLEILPLFSALVKLVSLISSVALLIQQMIYPYIAQNWFENQFIICKTLYYKGVYYSVGIAVLLSTIAWITAPLLIPIWLGKENYLGGTVFGSLLLLKIIYIHHCGHASAVIATGKTAFVRPAIVNAVLSIPLAVIGAQYGIAGVIWGNLIGTLLPSIYVVHWTLRFFNKPKTNEVHYEQVS